MAFLLFTHFLRHYLGLASAYMAVNDPKSAVSALEKAIETASYLIYPEDYEALIKTYQSMGDEANASQWRKIFEERQKSAVQWKREGSAGL
jgi:Tfp pilus assembly protein PilF